MKDFKDIKEGLLRGMDNTLNNGESDVQAVLKEQMMKYFLTNTSRPREKHAKRQSFMYLVGEDDPDTLIERHCSYDGTILTIDMTTAGKRDALKIYTYNGGSDLPMIKIIDKRSMSVKTVPDHNLCDKCNVTITSADSSTVDVESFIHPNTDVSSVAYDRNGMSTHNFKSNVFPGTVRNIFSYDCKFEHINTKAWPKCKLWFSQHVMIDMFMKLIGKENSKYDLGYPTKHLLIQQ